MALGQPIRFGVGVQGLTTLTRDLRNASEAIVTDFTAALKEAAAPVVSRAQANAAFSERIPSTIRMVASGGRARVKIAVRAGGAKAPEAAAFENAGKPGKFRHPVYGNRNVWVDQDAHPYLFPALVAEEPNVSAKVYSLVDEALRQRNL